MGTINIAKSIKARVIVEQDVRHQACCGELPCSAREGFWSWSNSSVAALSLWKAIAECFASNIDLQAIYRVALTPSWSLPGDDLVSRHSVGSRLHF